jgi:signal transduction histidine kinase
VTIRRDAASILLEIDDDGRGFDVGGPTAVLGIANALAAVLAALFGVVADA